MKTEMNLNYGEYVEITSPIQETEVMTTENVGGEIWYN